jgi:hypothetical protein
MIKAFFSKNQKGPKAPSSPRGFVALFTVLIAAVILAMAVGISNIALKQIILSSSATDANKAFYAADSGVECALYHDLKTLPPNSFDPGQGSSIISCDGVTNIAAQEVSFGFFSFSIPTDVLDACTSVTIDKTTPITEVISTGTFPCSGGSRTVERVIRVTY